MTLPKAPRAALDLSLRLARVPVDAAIDLMPGSGSGPRSVAQRVVDAIDSATRSLLGLRSEDREMREPPSDPPSRPEPPSRPDPPSRSASATRAPAPRRPPPPRRPSASTVRRPAPAPAPPAPAPPPSPSHQEIAARAFELYEHGVPGDAESHWRTAERELSTARDT